MEGPTQLDLFEDSESVKAANALYAALERADAVEARRAWDLLSGIESSHAWLPHAKMLIDALESPLPKTTHEAREALSRLAGDWTEAADTIFKAGGHRLLVPIWRAVGESLERKSFDPDLANLHASHAFARIGDWASVERSVREAEDFSAHPVLVARIAEATWLQGRRIESIGYWFLLCWRAPEEFERRMEMGRVPDKSLRDGWESGLDQDFEPAPTDSWFPAWMLLHEPGLALRIAPPTGTSAPEAAFSVLQSLTVRDRQDPDLRKQLQKLHAGLLKCFLGKR